METVTVLGLIALVKKSVDMLKYITNKQVNSAVTQLVVWVSSFVVLAIAGNADITENLKVFGEFTLGSLNFASLVLGGLLVGSSASLLAHDIPAALDNKDTARTPALLPAVAQREPLRT